MKTTSLAAILFVELSGFQDFLAANEAAAVSLLKAWRALADPVLEAQGGELVDATNDEFLVIFTSAVSALRCAIELRSAASGLSPGLSGPLETRAGIHLGEIWRDENRVYGNGINVAARVKAEAGPGQILVSEDVWRQVSNKLDLPGRAIPERHLKNIERSLAIYEVAFEAGSATPSAAPASAPATASLPRQPVPPMAPAPVPPIAPLARPESKSELSEFIEAIKAIKREGVAIRITMEEPDGSSGTEEDEAGDGGEDDAEDGDILIGTGDGSLSATGEKASRDIAKGAGKMAGALAVFGLFCWFYLQKPSLFLAVCAGLFGLLPALSGLKRLIKGLVARREAGSGKD